MIKFLPLDILGVSCRIHERMKMLSSVCRYLHFKTMCEICNLEYVNRATWPVCSADHWNLEGLLFYRKNTCGYKSSVTMATHSFPVPTLDFNVVVIFSIGSQTQANLLQIWKWNAAGGQKMPLILGVWNAVCCPGNKTVKLVSWSICYPPWENRD